MTPEDQLPLLIKAFEGMQRRQRGPNFIAGSRTYATADFRRMADKEGGEVGEVLHALLDRLVDGKEQDWWAELERKRLRIEELREAIKFARRRINKTRRMPSSSFQLLKEADEELKGVL